MRAGPDNILGTEKRSQREERNHGKVASLNGPGNLIAKPQKDNSISRFSQQRVLGENIGPLVSP